MPPDTMSPLADPALILTDGGLSGALACFIEGVCRPAAKVMGGKASPSGPSSAVCLILPAHLEPQREARLSAARRAAHLAHMGEVIEIGPVPFSDDPSLKEHGIGESALLMAAGSHAIRLGLSRMVWPVQVGGTGVGAAHDPAGPVLNQIADAFDRALVCARLLSIDSPTDGLAIQTPFVDFTDVQLADLAADVDLPMHAVYFDAGEDSQRRWSAAFTRVGLDWPPAETLTPVVTVDAARLRAV